VSAFSTCAFVPPSEECPPVLSFSKSPTGMTIPKSGLGHVHKDDGALDTLMILENRPGRGDIFPSWVIDGSTHYKAL